MPQIIETMSRRAHWGYVATNTGSSNNADWGNLEADWNTIDSKLADLAAVLSEDGWEIKSVVPLTGSRYYTQALTNHHGIGSSTWGAGYGYGAAYTEGVVVLCQRWVEVSRDEYDRRQQQRADKASAKAAAAQAQTRQDAHDRVMQTPVERKGFIDATWVFDGETYKTKDEAEAARMKLAKSKLGAA